MTISMVLRKLIFFIQGCGFSIYLSVSNLEAPILFMQLPELYGTTFISVLWTNSESNLLILRKMVVKVGQ